MIHQPTDRQKWFLDRIGKTIHRNSYCNCPSCQQIMEHGLVIADEQHADYLAGFEAETHMEGEGNPVHYFDSKEQVEEWLKTLPNGLDKR